MLYIIYYIYKLYALQKLKKNIEQTTFVEYLSDEEQ